MSVRLSCPKCASSFDLPDTLAGKTVRCTKCKATFTVPQASPPEAASVEEEVPVLQAADDPAPVLEPAPDAVQRQPRPNGQQAPRRWDQSYRTRSRRDDPDEDEPDNPNRTTLIVAGSIAAAVLVAGLVVILSLNLKSDEPPDRGRIAVAHNEPWPDHGELRNDRLDIIGPEPGPPGPGDGRPPGWDRPPGVIPPAGIPQPPAVKVPPDWDGPGGVIPPPVIPPPIGGQPEPVEQPGPELTPFKDAPNPFRESTQTRLRLTRTLKAPGNTVQMAYSPKHELLFVRNSGSGVWVVDARANKDLGMQSPQNQFSDFDLAPDESALFVADYGGERTGYGDPLKPHYVHRYDLAQRKWEKRVAPKIAYHLEAVDSWRCLLLEHDQWVDVTLNRWEQGQDKVKELSRIGSDYYGDMEYDPRTGRALHGSTGSSSQQISVRRIQGNKLAVAENTGSYGSAQGHGPGATLSSDGKHFYYGKLQVEALDVKRNLRTFPEIIVAASRDVAFGQKGYYDSHTGNRLGEMNGCTAFSVSPDGLSVWAFHSASNELRQYALEGDK